MNGLKGAAEGELAQVVFDHHITAIQDAGGFVKPAMTALFLGEDNTGGRATDLGAGRRVACRFVLVLVGLPVLVAARNAEQQVGRRAEVHSSEDGVFDGVGRIAVGAVEPLTLPPNLRRATLGERVIAAQFQCLAVETGVAAALGLG